MTRKFLKVLRNIKGVNPPIFRQKIFFIIFLITVDLDIKITLDFEFEHYLS